MTRQLANLCVLYFIARCYEKRYLEAAFWLVGMTVFDLADRLIYRFTQPAIRP